MVARGTTRNPRKRRVSVSRMKSQTLLFRPSFLLLAGIALLYLSLWRPGFQSYSEDSAKYILLSRSLARGEGYRDTFDPGMPPHTLYPPGFPLLLLLPIGVCGEEGFGCMRLTVILCAIVSSFLLWRLARLVSGGKRAWVVAIGMTIPFALWWTGEIATEWPYTAVSLGAMLAWAGGEIGGARKRLFFAGGLAGLALLFRTSGVALSLALPFARIVESRIGGRGRVPFSVWGLLLLLLLAFLPAAGWQVRNRIVAPEGSGYGGQWRLIDPYAPQEGTITPRGLLERVARTGRYYAHRVPELLLSPLGRWRGRATAVTLSFSLLFWGTVVSGGALLLQRFPLLPLYLSFYMGMLLLWPWHNERLLLPLLPLFGWLFVEGILGGLPGRGGAFLLSLLLLGNLWGCVRVIHGAYTAPPLPPEVEDFFAAHEVLASRISPGPPPLILSRKAAITHLLTGGKSATYPFTPDADLLLAEIERKGFDFVVVDAFSQETRRYLVPALLRAPERFEVIWRKGATFLLRVRHSPPGTKNVSPLPP